MPVDFNATELAQRAADQAAAAAAISVATTAATAAAVVETTPALATIEAPARIDATSAVTTAVCLSFFDPRTLFFYTYNKHIFSSRFFTTTTLSP